MCTSRIASVRGRPAHAWALLCLSAWCHCCSYDFCSPKLQKKLKVWRDEYADRELAATAAGAGAGADESKAASQAVKDESKAGADMEDDDEDLAAALAMSLEKNDADGDVKMVRGMRAMLASERHGS